MLGRTEKVILGTILIIGTALRIYNYWDFSLSNDELSALARLSFDSFSDLIINGVRIDGHPPAAQVILWYMTKWFGNSVAVVRLPFVLAGILSVLFMFRLAKEWISTSAGLLSAAAFATLEFPLLYSRIARPYALGMLFVLMAAFFWIRIVNNKQKPGDFIWLALSLALCAYSHYFAALTAAILAFTGLLLIKGQRLKTYLISLFGALLFFAPYIPNFLYQLNLGGVGQWLGPPQNDWILQHLFYVFNGSYFVTLTTIAVGSLGLFVFRPKVSFAKHILPLFLFLAPFLVGFFYSRTVNPVLQHSTLLFSFPFLLVFAFSGWEDGKERLSYAIVHVLVIITLWSSVVEKRFYTSNQFGVFKELAAHIVDWKHQVNDDVVLTGDFNLPFYIHYYLDRIEPTELALYRTCEDNGLAQLKSIVDTATANFLIYAWSTVNQAPEVEAIIQQKFPIEVERKTYFNSEVVMFTKGSVPWNSEQFQFEKTDTWNFNPDKVKLDTNNIQHVLIDGESPYGPTFSASVDTLIKRGSVEILVYLECTQMNNPRDIQLVYEQENEEGKYCWESDAFSAQFSATSPSWGVFHYQIKTAEPHSGSIKIFPWSPSGETMSISAMEIRYR
ncbi:MAG: hypothetical protein RL266_1629 [Bacteroidota bacterium]|jgi:hypothetical protein